MLPCFPLQVEKSLGRYGSLTSWFLHQCPSRECLHPHVDTYTQTPAHIRLLSRQPWSNSDAIVDLIRTCIKFPIRKPFLIVKWPLLLPSVEPGSRDWEPVAGDAYRQEVRENHLGTKGTASALRTYWSTPCAACRRNPIGVCVFCCPLHDCRCYSELGRSF